MTNTTKTSLIQQWQSRWQKLTDALAGLSSRDKMALSALLICSFVCLCYLAFEFHAKVQKRQISFDDKVSDYFWLRSQSGNLRADTMQGGDGDSQEPLSVQLSNYLRQAGISNPQVAQVGTDANHVQLSFSQPSQMLVSRMLNQLQQMGVIFERLDIQQRPDKSLIVQATVVKP